MRRLAILTAAAICLLVAGVAAYGRSAVLDERHFADRAASTLSSDEVRDEIASRTAARVVAKRPDLSSGETAIEEAAKTVAADPAFRASFRDALARMHHTLFTDADAQASLTVPGSGAALRSQLARRLTFEVPSIGDPPLMSIGANRREHALRELAPAARSAALPLAIAAGIAGLLLLLLGAATAPDRRTAVRSAAFTVAAAGAAVAAGVAGARDVVLAHFDTSFGDAVVSQIWGAYLGDLRTWGIAVAAAGLVVAAATGSRPDLTAVVRAPRSGPARLARAVGAVAVAALALTLPQLLLHVALVGLAAALFYVAVGDILRLAAPPHAAARGLRAASAAAAIVAVIAVAALPAAATEGAGEGLAAATTQPAATTHARAAKGRRQPRSREVCLSAREVKRLAAAGVQPPAGTHLRADGRLCGRR